MKAIPEHLWLANRFLFGPPSWKRLGRLMRLRQFGRPPLATLASPASYIMS